MPEKYHRHPEAGSLPEKTNVWLVQDSGKEYSGVVSAAYNFEGYPDDESLVAGCNAKSYPHTAIARHGNFLQWGYGEPPSKMTEDGRKLFLNCVCYIRKFAGQIPLVRRAAMNRRWAFHFKAFGRDLGKKYKGRQDELYALYKNDIELLYHEKRKDNYIVFLIDFELKNLGIESNRQISTIEQLIELLPDGTSPGNASENKGFFQRLEGKWPQEEKSKSAGRALERYTDEDFDTKQQWKEWLETNRERIYFTDFGGYKFRVIPDDYPDTISLKTTEEPFWFPR